MSGAGPSTQAARALRATRAAPGKAARSAQESQSGPSSRRQKDDDDDGEDERDLEGEDDSEHDEDGYVKDEVYHWQIWRQLLRKASLGGLVGYTNQQPASGDDPLDVTAVYTPQMHWDMDNRSYWPNCLKLWLPPNPRNNPTYEVGVMKYKGHVVLDTSGTPIRNFRIPLTISSKVEGLRVEAWMRLDDRLTLGDIEARLWTKERPGAGKVPAFDRRVLSKRASLDRFRAGLISWLPKKGRDAQTALMDSFRTPEQRANNEATDQDLTTHQKGVYAQMGLNENKKSEAPTRAERIRKIKRAVGLDDTVLGLASGAADPVAAADSEDGNSSSVGLARSEANLETQTQEQALEDDADDKASVSSSLIDPADSRHDQPVNPQEEASLRRALEISVDDFFLMMGQQPEPTYAGDNYFSQWGLLQQEFRNLWVARGNTTPLPRLRARDRWTGGISQFEFAEIIEGEWDEE